jgi:hypothetical protein
MPTLSAAVTAQIQSLINYLDTGSAGKTIDDTTANALANIFGSSCGFKCGCPGTFLEGLRDSPVSTLLKLLVCQGTIAGPGVAAGPSNPISPLLSVFGNLGILGASTVTNTGNTIVLGDLDLSPGSSVTGFPPGTVSGTQHITDTAAANAQLALTTAYLAAAGQTLNRINVAGDIGGRTLVPGLYNSTSSLAITSGNLTLDAGGVVGATWVFQIASTLTVANGRSILLAGGAEAKNIIWQVGSSATLGTTSIFKGSILALTSITVQTGALVLGRLLARNGAVTLDTNTVIAQ